MRLANDSRQMRGTCVFGQIRNDEKIVSKTSRTTERHLARNGRFRRQPVSTFRPNVRIVHKINDGGWAIADMSSQFGNFVICLFRCRLENAIAAKDGYAF